MGGLYGTAKEEINELWRSYIHTYAQKCSGGRWKPYEWLRHTSRIVTPKLLVGGARIIVEGPPRHGKSQLFSRWTPTWYLERFLDRKIILGSYGSTFASKWGAEVLNEAKTNPLVQIPLREDVQSRSKFMTKAGGQMMTAGADGTATGEGADLFIVDDIIKNWKDAQSPIKRQAAKDFFRAVALTRLEPNASVIVMMTRWHEDDLIGWLLENMDDDVQESLGSKWDRLRFPALAEEDDILGRSFGDALCPQRYTVSDLEGKRADLGSMIFEAMYQQNPYIQGGNIVKKDWLKFYRQYPTHLDEIIIVADLSFKKTETSDFACFEAWGRRGPDIFLLDQIRSRMDFPDQVRAFLKMIERHPEANAKVIEEAANGAAIISVLEHEIPGLIPVKPRTAKEARLAAVAPLYEGGNVYYPDETLAPWVKVNVQELLACPNGKNDDTVDCATMALSRLGQMNSVIATLEALGRW